MTLNATQSIAAPPVLFRLPEIAVGDGRSSPIIEAFNGEGQSVKLRLDPPARELPAPITKLASRRPRAARSIVDRANRLGTSIPEPDQDVFQDHAGDLISGLREWSMRLDRRESDLDQREHELNRRARFLRQHECGRDPFNPYADKQPVSRQTASRATLRRPS